MAFFAAPGVAQLVVAGQYGASETVVNVVHVQRKNDAGFDPWTQPQLRDAALRLGIAWQRWLPQLSSQVGWREIRSRDLSLEAGAVDLLPVLFDGATASAPTSPNVALLIQWRTGTAGRGANGRSYLPGALEGQIDALGRIEPAFVADMTTRAQGVIADLGAPTSALLPGVPLDLAILHKPKGVPLSRSATPVITGKCSNLVATQRRRLPKRA
jgi:hypothetical protein